jgi:hypothetical protein
MFRPRRVNNETTGGGRIFSVVVMAGLVFGWSRPAFPDEPSHLQFAPIQLAPIVGGEFGYTFQNNTYGLSSLSQQMLDLTVRAGVNARSYFWQPWFARVSGSLGISVTADTTSNSNGPTNKSGNKTITGDASLNILQFSRFPFLAHIYRQDTQTSGYLSGLNSNYINNGIGLTQNYRSLDGRIDGLMNLIHNDNGRINVGTENALKQYNFTVTALHPPSHQTFRINGARNQQDQPIAGNSNLTDALVVNHLFQPTSALSVASLVNFIKASYSITAVGTGLQQQNDYNSQQLSSFGSWRPEGSPLTMTSSLRLLKWNNNYGNSPQFDDSNWNLGANYAWSRFLRMYGSVNVNDNSGIQTVSTNAALSAQRGFGQRILSDVGGYRYSRSAGASISNATVTTNQSNQSTTKSVQRLGANLGHALDKTDKLGSGLLSINLQQGLATIISTLGSPSTNLNTSGSLIWNSTAGDGVTSVSFRASDSRMLTGFQNFFQIINLQASRYERLARHQSLIGNLTLQATRSGSSYARTPFIANPSADLRYRHDRLFGMRNMVFESVMRIVGTSFMSSQSTQGNIQGATVSWDNNVDYFIGRLRVRLYTRIAEVNNARQSSIYFNINRVF